MGKSVHINRKTTDFVGFVSILAVPSSGYFRISSVQHRGDKTATKFCHLQRY